MAANKRYQAAAAQIDRDKLYGLDEAFDVIVEQPTAKFDETVDIAINLGVDPKHADQMVRGTVVLPHGKLGQSPTAPSRPSPLFDAPPPPKTGSVM